MCHVILTRLGPSHRVRLLRVKLRAQGCLCSSLDSTRIHTDVILTRVVLPDVHNVFTTVCSIFAVFAFALLPFPVGMEWL